MANEREGAIPRAGWRVEALIVAAIFIVALAACWGYFRYTNIFFMPVQGEGNMYTPSIGVAMGHGFARPASPNAAVDAFMAQQTGSLNPADVPANTTWMPAQGKFHIDRFYLLYSVGIAWRIFGISWVVLYTVPAFFFACLAALVYGIFRLGVGRGLGVAGVVCTLASPALLGQLPVLRDFCKGPFILAVILLCGIAVSRPLSRRAYLGIAALLGLVIGTGFGFRQDIAATSPAALGLLIVFARGKDAPLGILSRLAAALIFVAAFLPPAWPMIRMTSQTAGNNSFYLLQGFSQTALEEIEIGQASYTPLHTNADEIVHGYVYNYMESQPWDFREKLHHAEFAIRLAGILQAQAMPLDPGIVLSMAVGPLDQYRIWSVGAEMTARRFAMALYKAFPGDVINRGYSTVLRLLRGHHAPFLLSSPADSLLDQLGEWEAPLHRFVYRFGPIFAVVGLLLIAAWDLRCGIAALCMVVLFLGYPSLLYQQRHGYHLGFASFWFLIFLLARVATIPRYVARFRSVGLRRESRLALGRLTGFLVFAVISLAVPLYAARLVQWHNLAPWIEKYRSADLEPLAMHAETRRDNHTLYVPDRVPAFEDLPPAAWWNRLLPMRQLPDIACEYFAADIETSSVRPELTIAYSRSEWGGFQVLDPAPQGTPRRLRYFFPAFKFTENFPEHMGELGLFLGLEVNRETQVTALYRVKNKADFPFVWTLQLPENPADFKYCQRLKF